ncbi:acyltransferase Pun1-like [Solanum stenotomum]|uniref:acyltransferase Pun1-like n=1 Tax=Solanum stenotomum TaxID=172797 RepID=UPI0020D1D62F|nr:acyltransferase Pun1-like [Solanum stenotomum]
MSSSSVVYRVPEVIGNEEREVEDEEMKAGRREASVMRYKEKRQNRLFSKTIRYQVRKLNAEKRPRVKLRKELLPRVYYQIMSDDWAGSLKDNATIECDDHGAEFFEVEINSSMDEVIHNPDLTFPQGLSWGYLSSSTSGALIVVQLSHFECGGIALSLCMSHKVGDACSAYYFLRDWARLTRDPKLTLSPPYFVQDSLMPSVPFDVPLFSPVIEPKKERCIQKRFVFSESKINALKALVVAESCVQNPTRNEVVSALLYKCAASSSTTNLGRSQLVQTSNLRSQAPLPPTSIGNIATIFSTPIYENYEHDLKLTKLVTDIRKSKHDLSTKNNLQENEYIRVMLEAYRTGKLPFHQRNCDVYTITSILAFEFEKIDIGFGKPTRASQESGSFSNLFILMNTPDDHDRGVEAFVNLNEQHMSVFKNDNDLLQFVTPF